MSSTVAALSRMLPVVSVVASVEMIAELSSATAAWKAVEGLIRGDDTGPLDSIILALLPDFEWLDLMEQANIPKLGRLRLNVMVNTLRQLKGHEVTDLLRAAGPSGGPP